MDEVYVLAWLIYLVDERQDAIVPTNNHGETILKNTAFTKFQIFELSLHPVVQVRLMGHRSICLLVHAHGSPDRPSRGACIQTLSADLMKPTMSENANIPSAGQGVGLRD